VILGEQYLKVLSGHSRHRRDEVSAYLAEIGKGSLKGWQFFEVADTLEPLFCKVVLAPLDGPVRLGVLEGLSAFPGAPSRTYRYRR
jgi:hypothetical protein